MASHPIPFIDLAAQQSRIRPQVEAAIARVLDHGRYIMGPEVAALEQKLAEFCTAKYAITCSSGTDALLLALMAHDIGPGDAVICPAFTYTATPEVVALIGATPIFADIQPETFNLDPTSLSSAIELARQKNLKPRIVIAVDLFGLPADYDTISQIAKQNALLVLADAAQSFGASLREQNVGTLGNISATSFFPAKPLGCYGDGGAVFTEDDTVASRLKSIRLHGKGAEKYDVDRIGINGRLDTIQAAILLEKLAIFPSELLERRRVAARYTEQLKDSAHVPRVPEAAASAWAQYTVRLPVGARDRVAAFLKDAGIPTQIYYPRPLHHQPAYKDALIVPEGLPVAEQLPHEVLSLPMHPYLSEHVQDQIIDTFQNAVSATS